VKDELIFPASPIFHAQLQVVCHYIEELITKFVYERIYMKNSTHRQQLRVARLDSLVLLGCGFTMIPSSGEETSFLFFHQSWKPFIQSWKPLKGGYDLIKDLLEWLPIFTGKGLQELCELSPLIRSYLYASCHEVQSRRPEKSLHPQKHVLSRC
jgi:hypothetical protein